MTPLTYTVVGAAEVLGCSKRFFREQVLPELAVIRRGRRVLIPHTSLEQWVEQHAA